MDGRTFQHFRFHLQNPNEFGTYNPDLDMYIHDFRAITHVWHWFDYCPGLNNPNEYAFAYQEEFEDPPHAGYIIRQYPNGRKVMYFPCHICRRIERSMRHHYTFTPMPTMNAEPLAIPDVPFVGELEDLFNHL